MHPVHPSSLPPPPRLLRPPRHPSPTLPMVRKMTFVPRGAVKKVPRGAVKKTPRGAVKEMTFVPRGGREKNDFRPQGCREKNSPGCREKNPLRYVAFFAAFFEGDMPGEKFHGSFMSQGQKFHGSFMSFFSAFSRHPWGRKLFLKFIFSRHPEELFSRHPWGRKSFFSRHPGEFFSRHPGELVHTPST